MSTFFDSAQWLSSTECDVSTLHPAHYFRIKFNLKSSIKTATLRYSALGVLEPWINGERVHEDYFTPGWSDYRKRAYVSTYDVVDRLSVGDNCLGLVLADGWAGAPFGPKGHAVAFAPRTMFIAELVVTYANGETESICSNADWKWRTGAVTRNSIYNGETYDARKAIEGWSSYSGSDRGWKVVDVPEAPGIKLREKKCPPVRITETLQPVELRQDKRKWIADFGQNLVGSMRVLLRNTKRGQKIVFKFAEMLEADGSIYTENLRAAEATDIYYCEGADEESYMPRFTFHGFRYAQIEGLSKLESGDLFACVMHNDLKKTGEFRCTNEMLNKLQSSIVWGQRGNFFEAPTDCPQRDERLGWSGDVQVFINTACFNYDCEGFYRQWMDAMRDGQREDGAFPDTAPDILGWHGNAGWGDAGVIVPYTVWIHYGSLAIVEENWSAMECYIDFLTKQSMGYIQPSTLYGDWLAVDATRPEWAPTPKDLIGTAYFAMTVKQMSLMAEALGKSERSTYFTELFEHIKVAFQERFITRTGHVLGNTQTSYLLALGFDLVQEELFQAAADNLIECLAIRNWHLSTGFLGTPLLNPVLTKIGRCDVAYRLLLNETYPSWLYPIKNGATTMWERWNSWTKDNGFGPVEMNSFNHYAYGAIGEWIYQRMCGIAPHPDFPGYKRAVLAPLPGGGILSGGGQLNTRVGTYVSRWEVEGSKSFFDFEIPEGAEAVLRLPSLDWSQIQLDGELVPQKYKQESTSRFCKCELLLPGGKFHVVVENLG